MLVFFLFIHRNNNTGSRLSCILLYLSLLLHSPRAFILLLFRRVRVRFRTNTEWKKNIYLYTYILYMNVYFFIQYTDYHLVLPLRYLKWIRLFIWRDNIKLLFFFIFKTQNKDNKNKINNKYTPSYPQK